MNCRSGGTLRLWGLKGKDRFPPGAVVSVRVDLTLMRGFNPASRPR